jgi:peptidoglycan L-alanyl-D-glutamate endopeptidase CwlK
MTITDHQWQFLQHVSELIRFAALSGIKLTGGELWRTQEQQEWYVDKGLSKTIDSNHLKRMAIDFNFFIDGKLTYNHQQIKKLGEFWESLSHFNRWGGNFKSFKDTPHFERHIQ